jgi:leucine dehydrogenase
MKMFTSRLDVEGYEAVYQYLDDGFHAFISIHSTKLGPALGGCRIHEYETDKAALTDALRLSKGMTYKNSAAGLNFGGAKCVVNTPRATRDVMLKVGEIVESLGGNYITGEDIGTTVADIKIAAEKTKHVLSLGAAGDPSPWTSLGVYECINAVRAASYLDDTRLTVWVQGLGKVGWGLAKLLHEHGYALYVSDLNQDLVDDACAFLGAKPYRPDDDYDIDIYAPCAMGAVVNRANVHTIPFPIICGSANNQLESDDLAEILHQRAILYCPDYLVNAGGVIAAAAEITGFDEDKVRQDVCARGRALEDAIRVGGERGDLSPLAGANYLAEMRLK